MFLTYFIISRYYEDFQIDRRTGESNLTQLYIQVCPFDTNFANIYILYSLFSNMYAICFLSNTEVTLLSIDLHF